MTPLRGLAARAQGDERGDLPVVTVLILFLAAAIMAVLTGTVSDATSTIGATASAARNASAVELATSAADAFYGQLEADPSHVSSIWPYLDVWAQFAPSGSVEACSSGIHNDCFRLDVKVSSSGQAGVTATQVGPSSPAGLPQQAATLTVTASVDCRMGGTVANPTPTCSTNTIVQHLRRRTFLDYLYFVDHNSLDPNVASTIGGSSTSTLQVWKRISYNGYDVQAIANRHSSSVYAWATNYIGTSKMISLTDGAIGTTEFGNDQLSAPISGSVSNLHFTGMIVYRYSYTVFYTRNYDLESCYSTCSTTAQSSLDGQDFANNTSESIGTPYNGVTGAQESYSHLRRYETSGSDVALVTTGPDCNYALNGLLYSSTACSTVPNPAGTYSVQNSDQVVSSSGGTNTIIGYLPATDGTAETVRSPATGVVFVLTSSGNVVEFVQSTETVTSGDRTANPAYQGSPSTGDVIDGPIHTNSGPIPVCGSPTFEGAVEVSGASSGSGWTQASGQGCANSAPRFTNPAGGVTTGSPVLPLPASDSSLEQIAAGGGPPWSGQTGYAFSGNIAVTIDGGTLDVTDPSGVTHTGVAFPATGVIYATGDITVSGTNDGRLTLAAGGSITVTGNLDYGCAAPGITPVPGSCPDVTGLVAEGNIWLYGTGASGPSTADLEAASLTVDAAMLSLSNSIDATGPGGKIPVCPIEQLSGGATSLCPTLTVNGAMATSYRGLFGFYDANSGELATGWHKDFVYDTRLFNLQPPWFLTPLAGQWVRSSPAVVGASGS